MTPKCQKHQGLVTTGILALLKRDILLFLSKLQTLASALKITIIQKVIIVLIVIQFSLFHFWKIFITHIFLINSLVSNSNFNNSEKIWPDSKLSRAPNRAIRGAVWVKKLKNPRSFSIDSRLKNWPQMTIATWLNVLHFHFFFYLISFCKEKNK